jgi:uracil-DNA glycosylase
MEKQSRLKALYDRVETPTRRLLGNTPARFVRGDGNPDAAVVLIGEAPGLNEDREGKPFVGRAGQLLNQWLESIGLKRADVYITNLVKCHPMKNPATPDVRGNDRPPTPFEVETCWPIVQEELAIIQPKVLVPLGSPATRAILKSKQTITALRGCLAAFAENPAIHVFPLFHPAAMFHNPLLRPEVLKDLQALKAWLEEIDVQGVKSRLVTSGDAHTREIS